MWRYLLNEAAVQALMVCDDADARRLVVAFESLAASPFASADWTVHSPNGPVGCRKVGRLVVSYWLEHSTREVRIVDIGSSNL